MVLCGVDATTMSKHFFLTTQRFHRIVYNFPHVGFAFPEGNACQIKSVLLLLFQLLVCYLIENLICFSSTFNRLNKQLVKGFLMNAKVLLKKKDGEIHVTHKVGDPYDKWDLVKKANKIDLVLYETVPFYKHMYPGYAQKRAHGRSPDAAFQIGESTTFKFRLN